MEDVEDIADEPIPHMELTRAIYTYIWISVSYLTLDDPTSRFILTTS